MALQEALLLPEAWVEEEEAAAASAALHCAAPGRPRVVAACLPHRVVAALALVVVVAGALEEYHECISLEVAASVWE